MGGFEWDEAKRQATLAKHGIDFVRAVEVFHAFHVEAPARSETEERRMAVGVSDGLVIAVIFTRRGETVRIITARRARENERANFWALYDRADPAHGRQD